MTSDPVHVARSRRARTVRAFGRESTQAIEAKRDLAAALLERDVQRVLADAPPLSDEQAHRIANLLLAGGGI